MLISEIIPLMRPRTLAAAFSPVFIGATFSYYAFGAAHGTGLALFHSLLIFLAVVCAQIVANMWNEYCDFKSGLDHGQKIGNAGSVTRGAISMSLLLNLIKGFTVIPLLIGIYLSATITWWYIPAGLLCILISFLYSGGPKPISRTPFGEIASGLAMGLAIVLITSYAWTRELSWALWIPAIPSIYLVGAIMLTNNIRDYENDKSHGRRTLPIVLGRDRALNVMSTGYFFIYMWLFAWIYQGNIPITSLLALLSAIPAAKVVSILVRNDDVFKLDKAMSFTAMASILYNILWGIGLIIGKFILSL
ncbi:UbiA family prenyltransferase [Veillonella sp. YH-vei2232]|uniref:UbiA family prenyltransferase n=1 Tax=Veillonella absiana TaxID=3079305 RepID=A0ABU3Z5W0_9FIRM|nr:MULTISPECIES: UbiA family prenyltransferase [unclassified Veillonella]MDV5063802.1 UbiA family prenyltransferase [Veillonella sp. YH-vei2232]MDV5087300.1 UbiA family prenyltransferase [Veillonella sp. YH-vei2233]